MLDVTVCKKGVKNALSGTLLHLVLKKKYFALIKTTQYNFKSFHQQMHPSVKNKFFLPEKSSNCSATAVLLTMLVQKPNFTGKAENNLHQI